MLVITRSASVAASPSTRVWVAGSSATCPDTNAKPLASVTTEYGPTGLGPWVMVGTDLGMAAPAWLGDLRLPVARCPQPRKGRSRWQVAGRRDGRGKGARG